MEAPAPGAGASALGPPRRPGREDRPTRAAAGALEAATVNPNLCKSNQLAWNAGTTAVSGSSQSVRSLHSRVETGGNAGPGDPGRLHAEDFWSVGVRILILEDDPFIAMDLQAIVEGQGHEVVGAFDTLAEAREHL